MRGLGLCRTSGLSQPYLLNVSNFPEPLFLASLDCLAVLSSQQEQIHAHSFVLGPELQIQFSEAQSWRKRNMTHQCSHERAPTSTHASAHASVHESALQSWLSLCYSPIQRLPLECSRECSRGCPHKCTRSGLVVCHLVCFTCSVPYPSIHIHIREKIKAPSILK